jgi:hypothetical protein
MKEKTRRSSFVTVTRSRPTFLKSEVQQQQQQQLRQLRDPPFRPIPQLSLRRPVCSWRRRGEQPLLLFGIAGVRTSKHLGVYLQRRSETSIDRSIDRGQGQACGGPWVWATDRPFSHQREGRTGQKTAAVFKLLAILRRRVGRPGGSIDHKTDTRYS